MSAFREALLGAMPALAFIMVADATAAWLRTSALLVTSFFFGR